LSLDKDADYFLELQTHTGWGQVLGSFASWCTSSLDSTAQPTGSALDIGCGPGLLPAFLSRLGFWAVGVDLEIAMFLHAPLYSLVLQADGLRLPFAVQSFDLVTASNYLFLMMDPVSALGEMVRVLRPGGQVCLLNPSEKMSVAAARELADSRNLSGLARDTLLNWAQRAEIHQRWDEPQMQALLASAGLQLQHSELRVGLGLARFTRACKRT
jgi:SAM-dependent methyltransferase